MLNSPREVRDTARLFESRQREGRANEFNQDLTTILRSGQIQRERISMRSLFESFVDDGRSILDTFRPGYYHDGRSSLMEAGDAVDTSAFSNIIGQITYSTVLDVLDGPDFIADALMTTVPAGTQQQEIIPGIAMIGDQASDIGEGQDYPFVGLGEEYITTPRKVKDGFILPLTEEAIYEDKTGLLMQRANKATESLGITWEKERLDMALGITTSYSRNGGPQQATYGDTHTQGDFDNLVATNALVDYTDVEAALLMFDDITDPNTGEPVLLGGNLDIVVPTALEFTLARILHATSIEQGAISAGVPRVISGNPIQVQNRRTFTPHTSQYVKQRTSSTSTWFIGNFKKAFQYREIWPLQVFHMDRNSSAGFNRDIVTAIKVRRKGAPTVIEPRVVGKSTG